MKRTFLPAAVVSILLLLFTGCKKEHFNNQCRLTSWEGLDDGYVRSLQYNNDGLVSGWHEVAPLGDVDQDFTFEYNNYKRLISLRFYDHGTFLYTVKPVYENGRIKKEIWYIEDTETTDDTVLNTYNLKGQVIKRESLNYGYFAAFKYDDIGNATQIDVMGTDGTWFQTEYLEFKKPVREPMNAVPGNVTYPIQYINYNIDKLKYTYYKAYGPDENGDVVTFYELDTEKSVPLTAGAEGYAVYYNTFDNVSQLFNRQIWKYDNCDCGDNNAATKTLNPSFNTITGKNQRSPYITVPQMRQMIKERKLKMQQDRN
jgi:hypothetical protein